MGPTQPRLGTSREFFAPSPLRDSPIAAGRGAVPNRTNLPAFTFAASSSEAHHKRSNFFSGCAALPQFPYSPPSLDDAELDISSIRATTPPLRVNWPWHRRQRNHRSNSSPAREDKLSEPRCVVPPHGHPPPRTGPCLCRAFRQSNLHTLLRSAPHCPRPSSASQTGLNFGLSVIFPTFKRKFRIQCPPHAAIIESNQPCSECSSVSLKPHAYSGFPSAVFRAAAH